MPSSSMRSPLRIIDCVKSISRPSDETETPGIPPGVLISHTGVKGTCDNARNLDDTAIREIAGTRGVVGIGYWETAVCGKDAAAIARAIRYVANLVGIDNVGLGSDFDGAIAAPFDTTGLGLLVDALLREGFKDGDIAKIMGGNTLRVLSQVLPARDATHVATDAP